MIRLVLVFAAALAAPAFAETTPDPHAGHAMPGMAADASPSTAAYQAANAAMHMAEEVFADLGIAPQKLSEQ